MATRTKTRKGRAPRRGGTQAAGTAPPRRRGRRFGSLVWLGLAVLAAGAAFWLAKEQATDGGEAIEAPARGLPHTPDYHSLLVDAEDPRRLLLGTHVGVYESRDGGVRWRFAGLEGQDAMHFAREEDGTVWVAGHNVLAKSEDGGATWEDSRPTGLPGLDIHGFATSPEREALVYAAVAGEGLYRSFDGGRTFERISRQVGPAVMALAVTSDGAVFAADSERGVVVNARGDGREWSPSLDMPSLGLASNGLAPPKRRLLAAGRAVQLTADGRDWSRVLSVQEQAGPVAFAPSNPEIAYVVGFDRKLYRSEDGGKSWQVVT